MKDETIQYLVESYLNGNIQEVRTKLKRMSKADFITFLEGCRANGLMPYQLRGMV